MSAADRLNQGNAPTPSDAEVAMVAAAAAELERQTAAAVPGTSGGEAKVQVHKSQVMKAHLAKQPKVRVRLQRDTVVVMNGHTIHIQGGHSVMVPQQVAELLEESGRI